jgi:hypothetical protein
LDIDMKVVQSVSVIVQTLFVYSSISVRLTRSDWVRLGAAVDQLVPDTRLPMTQP